MAKYSVIQTECAELLKSLAEAVRLRIVYILFDNEEYVSDIAKKLKLSQPHVSHHLKILKDAGIVTKHRRDHKVFYSLTAKMRNKFSTHDRTIHLKCCSITFKGKF
jgi:DNA-binding transcriptional ArsR family regulator